MTREEWLGVVVGFALVAVIMFAVVSRCTAANECEARGGKF